MACALVSTDWPVSVELAERRGLSARPTGVAACAVWVSVTAAVCMAAAMTVFAVSLAGAEGYGLAAIGGVGGMLMFMTRTSMLVTGAERSN
ncbi:hypothetical protein N825_30890 [Skermanella stibiiresistens SB22]|uniref:Uncharacterized protein n=1 Tax=Skermanella stibiiresistens SB22 TaxID=1385369 RepID=W9H5C5_9PROT|nr:hypothetical protein [Skermanella stibiiresistens]EWY41234.1 hypothetical protein N825_30890 [Skermanella stibiiresistens SB22]